MAGDGGLPPRSVARALFDAPHRFDFLQAVRVLQALRPASDPAGHGPEPASEAVRFRSQVSLGFPPSDIVGVEEPPEGGPPVMTVAFLGLAGVQGPLPRSFTEQVMRQARVGDTAALHFLDLFNHRLVGLMYRARARHRPALEPGAPPHEGPERRAADGWSAAGPDARTADRRNPARDAWMSRYLFSLMGLGTQGLGGNLMSAPRPRPDARTQDGTQTPAPAREAPARKADPDPPALPRRALLGYAALLSTETRSAVGLERILSTHFGVNVRVVPFTGGWMRLEEEDQTRIGFTGQNRALGHDAVLGRRVWDAQGAFTVRVGPLSLGDYMRLLPSGPAFRALCALTRFYVGMDMEFTVSLVLRGREVPPARLGARAGARLGWTSWLRTRPRPPGHEGDTEVRLNPAPHGADPIAPPSFGFAPFEAEAPRGPTRRPADPPPRPVAAV